MATQGLLAIVDENGATLIKVICGCDGMDIFGLADEIIMNQIKTAEEIFLVAPKFVGCPDCLYVQDANKIYSKVESDVPLLYVEKFSDPNFNPRWECGLVDRKEILVLKDGAITRIKNDPS